MVSRVGGLERRTAPARALLAVLVRGDQGFGRPSS